MFFQPSWSWRLFWDQPCSISGLDFWGVQVLHRAGGVDFLFISLNRKKRKHLGFQSWISTIIFRWSWTCCSSRTSRWGEFWAQRSASWPNWEWQSFHPVTSIILMATFPDSKCKFFSSFHPPQTRSMLLAFKIPIKILYFWENG